MIMLKLSDNISLGVLSDKTVFNQYDQSCQSDSKEYSHFATFGTFIILTEPPTKNNCFTATITYNITLQAKGLH